MKKVIHIILIGFCFYSYGQDYDLVVTNKGDSIACYIDSINNLNVHFEMKFNGEWRHTYLSTEDILFYNYKSLFKDSIRFQSNSSYLKPYNQLPKIDRPKTNVNLMLFGYASLISISAERSFFINNNIFICANFGIGYNEEFLLFNTREPNQYYTYPHHITISFGRYRNFIESGLGGTYISGNTSQHYLLYPIIGYRLQPVNYNKINFRAFIHFPFTRDIDDILFVFYGASVGFSF